MEDFWHGSELPRSGLRPGSDGGIHLGTFDQASMRNPAFLHRVRVDLSGVKTRRSRDRGGDWATRISAARQSGFAAIEYLNRYEGLPVEVAIRIASEDLDRLPDNRFAKAVPESGMSVIILDPKDIRVEEIVAGRGSVTMFHACDRSKAARLQEDGYPGGAPMRLCSDPVVAGRDCDGNGGDTILSVRLRADSLVANENGPSIDWVKIAELDLPWYLETVTPLAPVAFRHIADLEPGTTPGFA